MSRDSAHTHSPEELERVAAVHLRYEVRAMIVMSRAGVLPPSTATDDTAVLEAFLVHVRLLDEFLSKPRSSWGRVVLATDYLESWGCPEVLTPAERNAIDRKVVHLACDREQLFDWLTVDIRDGWTDRVLRALQAFVSALPDERKRWFSPWFEDVAVLVDQVRRPTPHRPTPVATTSSSVVSITTSSTGGYLHPTATSDS